MIVGLPLTSALYALGVASRVPQQSSTLLDGLDAYWKMEEASGNRLDSVGSLHLVPTNNPGNGTGRVNQAVVFDETLNQRLVVADDPKLRIGSSEFAMHLWFCIDSFPGLFDTKVIMQKWGATTPECEYILDLTNLGGGDVALRWLVFVAGGSSVGAEVNVTVATATWYSILVYHETDGTIGITFNNSINAEASAGSVQATSTPLTFGAFFTTTRNLNGRIDEAAKWNRKPTSDEQTELFNGGLGITYPFN